MNAKVTDLGAFRLKKNLSGERRVSLQDAFQVSKPTETETSLETLSTGSIRPSETSSFDDERPNRELAERIERLKSSINRINSLMDELRGSPQPKSR